MPVVNALDFVRAISCHSCYLLAVYNRSIEIEGLCENIAVVALG
jgi:hypothetical protein